jgi:hypothetical protein
MTARWLRRPPPTVLGSAWVIRAIAHPKPKRDLMWFSNLALEGIIVLAIFVLGCC